MSEPRVIKKYPNRRLYDTVQSKYITLSDIRALVLERIEFVVIDKKSQDDITRSILLQVIAEQEHGVDPVMSRDFLSQVTARESESGRRHGSGGNRRRCRAAQLSAMAVGTGRNLQDAHERHGA